MIRVHLLTYIPMSPAMCGGDATSTLRLYAIALEFWDHHRGWEKQVKKRSQDLLSRFPAYKQPPLMHGEPNQTQAGCPCWSTCWLGQMFYSQHLQNEGRKRINLESQKPVFLMSSLEHVAYRNFASIIWINFFNTKNWLYFHFAKKLSTSFLKYPSQWNSVYYLSVTNFLKLIFSFCKLLDPPGVLQLRFLCLSLW